MCIRDRNLLPTYDDLLPPAEAFTDSGDDDDGGWQNDGDPTNDQGNAGWGFTSISDMFDGGGPGQSGDSYSGGIHGDNTVGDTSEGFTSVVSDWFGGGSDDNDSGGGFADTIINNSLLGTIGGATTGENLLPTYDDLLPPPNQSLTTDVKPSLVSPTVLSPWIPPE